MNEFPDLAQKKESDSGNGCAVGCATAVLLTVAAGVFLFLGGPKILGKLADAYTSPAPANLPTIEFTQQEASDLKARVEAFQQAVKEQRHGQELTLSARDINVLIQNKESGNELAGKLYVNMEGDHLTGEVSLPLEKLGSVLKGRWLNGSAAFRVETAAGRLQVFMDTLSVHGKPLPEFFMADIRGKNLAEEAVKDPKNMAALEKIGSISVRDGKLRIVSK